MTTQLSYFSLLTLLLTGCFQEEKTTSNSTDESIDSEENNEELPPSEEIEEEEEIEEPTEPAFSPIDGTWIVQETEILEDGCGLGEELDRGEPGTPLDLWNNEESEFTMHFENSEYDVECFLGEELSYNCLTNSEIDDRAADFGMNAPILAYLTTTGTFQDEHAMRMETTVELSCDGPDCGTLELLGYTFPCTMRVTSNISSFTE